MSEAMKCARPARPRVLGENTHERGPWVVVLVSPRGVEILLVAQGLTEEQAQLAAADPRDWLEQALSHREARR